MVVIGSLPALMPSIDTSEKKRKHRASSTWLIATPDKKKRIANIILIKQQLIFKTVLCPTGELQWGGQHLCGCRAPMSHCYLPLAVRFSRLQRSVI